MTWIGLRNIGKWIMDGDDALKTRAAVEQKLPPRSVEIIKEDAKQRFNVELDDKEAQVVGSGRVYRERQTNEHKHWSDKECKLLVKLQREGKSIEEIAAELGRTFMAVKIKLDKVDTHKWQPWTEKEEAIVIKMREEGKSLAEISQVIKRTPHAIGAKSQELVRAGRLKLICSTSTTSWSSQDKATIEPYLQKGRITRLEAESVANTLNRTLRSVTSYCYNELQRRQRVADKEFVAKNYRNDSVEPSGSGC